MNLIIKHEDSKVNKRLLDLKQKDRNGIILNVSRATKNFHNIRFIFGRFNNTGQVLVLIDIEGHIFLIDFLSSKYWNIPNPVDDCTAVKFSNYNDDNILIGTKCGAVYIINIQSGHKIASLLGHKYFVKSISCSSNFLCLTSSVYEAIVWDLQNNIKVQVLNLDHSCSLKQVVFMPVTNNIFTCFDDNTIEIWDPIKYEMKIQLSPKLWCKHPVRNAVFSLDGKTMVLGCQTGQLALFLLNNYELAKFITLPERIQVIKHIELIPNINDGGCNKMLTILTGRGTLCFYDLEKDFITKELISDCEIVRSNFSSKGVYFLCILCSGNVHIYDYMNYIIQPKVKVIKAKILHHNAKMEKYSEKMLSVKEQIKDILDMDKLKLILKEHGQYPDIHRTKIWEQLLELPHERELYNSIIDHRIVNSFENLERTYPLKSKRPLKNLRKVLDNLVNWCPFLLNVQYLPHFVFPFVKVFDTQPIICFEAMCTILMNWCQFWFEYFPLPPLNILAMIENMLMEHDPELLNFFTFHKVFSETYGWKILQTAFSEVLTAQKWKVFWDHILTNEPSFLLCGVVAFNILQKPTLLTFKSKSELDFFYSTYYPIDLKKLLRKTYYILRNTKEHIHPRQYLYLFKKIDPGKYPVLNDYPKSIIEKQSEEKSEIKNEINKLIVEEVTLLKDRLKNLEEAERSEMDIVENKRLFELEQTVNKTVLEEHELLEHHYENVTALRRAYQEEDKTINSLKQMVEEHFNNRKLHHTLDLNNELLNLLKKRYKTRKNDDELLFNYSELIKNKNKVVAILNEDATYGPQEQETIEIIGQIKGIRLIKGIHELEGLIEKIEKELKKGETRINTNSDRVSKLQEEAKFIMHEVQNLLPTLS